MHVNINYDHIELIRTGNDERTLVTWIRLTYERAHNYEDTTHKREILQYIYSVNKIWNI